MNPGDEQMLTNLANEMASDQAKRILDRQLANVRKWMAAREARGEDAGLPDLIKQVHGEPNKRSHIIAAYCAAVWRLKEIEDEHSPG